MTGYGEGRRDSDWTSAIHYCQCLGTNRRGPARAETTRIRRFPSNAELIYYSHLRSTTEQSACSRMSGPGEERYVFSFQILFVNKPDHFTDKCTSRWRGGRPQDQNRQSGQRHSNSRNMGAHSGNRGGQSPAPWSDSRDQLATGPSQEHVPVRGFNSAELKAALRRGRHSLIIYSIL